MSNHPTAPSPSSGMFRSLGVYNYRVWASGALVSNIGTWMQRTAQDWMVLAELTHHNATAVGIVMGLQFGPQILLLPFTGLAADVCDRRKLLMVTQGSMGLLATLLGLLTLTGWVQLWHVYGFAFLLGCVAAFDAPARQTFVSELVDERLLSNAVALNSTSFNAARMIGPAIAGVLIAAIGSGWVFLLNAVTFGAVLASLCLLKQSDLRAGQQVTKVRGGLSQGFRYVASRRDILAVLIMLSLIGTFAINFPIFISTMAVTVFHAGAGEYGVLTSMLAVGSVTGALLAARREKPRSLFLFVGAVALGIGLALSALMPNTLLFSLALMIVGLSAQTFNTTANSAIQLWTEPAMRGRVMAIFMALAMGGTPIGAPMVGWVADVFGPRWSLAVGSAAGFAAAGVGIYYLVKYRHLRVRFEAERFCIQLDPAPAEAKVTVLPTPTQRITESASLLTVNDH